VTIGITKDPGKRAHTNNGGKRGDIGRLEAGGGDRHKRELYGKELKDYEKGSETEEVTPYELGGPDGGALLEDI